ncbi:uncharacterized protein LOC115755489 [Rhodamnia argentea]|uniref:Uncharacterized protein LOC115755489 n=1 Tax=Rhodamnia argentea TaxID=178133 RepID=A0ABM3GYL9_9MYRT|nr:uncharacterized protein LOC115755489 [Rhodamnia argentea]
MDSSASLVTLKCSSSRRAPSLSPPTSSLRLLSWSSSSSLLEPSDFPELCHGSVSPFYPLAPVASSGVPFSWEKIPGIPKNQLSWRTAQSPSTSPLLPLPPAAVASAASSLSSKKHRLSRTASAARSSKRDPFVSAIVKCSKDDGREMTGNHRVVARVSRRISNGLGFVNLASCKQTCAVSHSVVYVTGSNRASSDLFCRRIGQA